MRRRERLTVPRSSSPELADEERCPLRPVAGGDVERRPSVFVWNVDVATFGQEFRHE